LIKSPIEDKGSSDGEDVKEEEKEDVIDMAKLQEGS
jgi:hypothetical protein